MLSSQLLPPLVLATALFGACSGSDSGSGSRDDETESPEGGAGGAGGRGPTLYDPSDVVEVCTALTSEAACIGAKFDLSDCNDCVPQCHWGTVPQLYERYPGEDVFGADGRIIELVDEARGGAGGGVEPAFDEAGCYIVAGDGG